ncbi:MAG: amidohydrolase family protein, partial [Bacteroidia bacterium]|nr:amidohydrolase family protein [Bacteroidia bacterium]
MKNLLYACRYLAMLLLGFVFIQSISAQNEPGPITHTYAIENATIITKPGQMISNGTVVVKNGLIHAAGTNVSIPSNAKVLKGDSLFVYAAFIDGLSHIGVPKPKAEANNNQQRGRGNNQRQGDPGNPTNERAGITPDGSVQDKLKHDDKSISDYRKVGFGAAHTVPRGRMLPGQGSVIVLEGTDSEDLVLKASTSTFAQLRGAGGVYPATVIGVMSKFRELYRQAEQARAHIDKYKMNPTGIARPNYDDAILALIPVVKKEVPIYYMAEDHLAMSRVMALQKELGFKLAFVGAKKGWHHIDAIKSKNIPVFLSMDLPKAPADKKKKEKKKATADNEPELEEGGEKAMKEEPTEFDKEKEALQARKDQEYKDYVAQAATFAKAGVNFGFITEGTNGKDIHGNLRRMIEHGLSEDAALAALTTYPAQQLGVSRMLGSVEKGKVANLMVTNMPYFEEKAAIRYM